MSGTYQVTMGDRGRLVIPAELRERVGLAEGTPLVLLETPKGLVLLTRSQLQDLVRADLAGLDLVGEAGLAASMYFVSSARNLAPEAERDNHTGRHALEMFESRLGLVARQLARSPYLAGDRFSKEYISQIERGKTRPTAETMPASGALRSAPMA